jgi:simple sugar transport system permease protein
MQMNMGISSYAADVLQGIILFCFLGSEFFVRYSLVFKKSRKGAK